MIVNFVIVALLLCLVACLGYIYWLHRKTNIHESNKKIDKKIDKKVDEVDDEDDITFLNSNYDPSITTKDDDDIFPDGEDTTTTDTE